MSQPPAAQRLYSPEILALAVSLADYADPAGFGATGTAQSRTCGSTLQIGLAFDANGAITSIGMRAAACAIGQAAAAIFAQGAAGRTLADVATTRDGLVAWLAGEGAMPDWPGLGLLDAARAFPARHGAILLAWNAALSTR